MLWKNLPAKSFTKHIFLFVFKKMNELYKIIKLYKKNNPNLFQLLQTADVSLKLPANTTSRGMPWWCCLWCCYCWLAAWPGRPSAGSPLMSWSGSGTRWAPTQTYWHLMKPNGKSNLAWGPTYTQWKPHYTNLMLSTDTHLYGSFAWGPTSTSLQPLSTNINKMTTTD